MERYSLTRDEFLEAGLTQVGVIVYAEGAPGRETWVREALARGRCVLPLPDYVEIYA